MNPYQVNNNNMSAQPMQGYNMNMAQPMQMQGLNMALGSPFVSNIVVNGNYTFNGNQITLNSNLQNISVENQTQIVAAHLLVTGTMLKSMDMCCLLTTIICGSIFLFPLCFMCCGWWKKIAYPTFEIRTEVYQAIVSKLLNLPNIQTITLHINDNLLDSHKAHLLYEGLSRSNIRGFTLINMATESNYNNNQYDNFVNNFKPIKSLNLSSDIRWGTTLVM